MDYKQPKIGMTKEELNEWAERFDAIAQRVVEESSLTSQKRSDPLRNETESTGVQQGIDMVQKDLSGGVGMVKRTEDPEMKEKEHSIQQADKYLTLEQAIADDEYLKEAGCVYLKTYQLTPEPEKRILGSEITPEVLKSDRDALQKRRETELKEDLEKLKDRFPGDTMGAQEEKLQIDQKNDADMRKAASPEILSVLPPEPTPESLKAERESQNKLIEQEMEIDQEKLDHRFTQQVDLPSHTGIDQPMDQEMDLF